MATLRIAAVKAGRISLRDKAIRDWVDSYRERIKRYYPNATFETEFVLGCSLADFVTHIDERMQPGMMWENKKEKWIIESIRSAQSCEIDTPVGFYKYFHYTNMRPRWKKTKGFMADPIIPHSVDHDGEQV